MKLNTLLYIDNQRVDFFDDEPIELNKSVKNFRALDKIFSDYSQSFNIPASGNNNVILSHWYEPDVTIGFNPAISIPARIEINHLPYRTGYVKIEKAQIKQGEIYSYALTFYSETRGLSESFGEDLLTELNLRSYRLNYSSFDTALTSSTSSGNVIIPLISPVRAWNYKATTDADSIKYSSSGQDYGLMEYELKPAIRIGRVIDAIETKYGITFDSDFFDSADFENLYLWGSNAAGYTKEYANNFTRLLEDQTPTQPPPFNFYDTMYHEFVVTDSTGINTNTFEVTINMFDDDTVYDLIAFDTTGQTILAQVNGLVGDSYTEILIDRPAMGQPNQTIFFAVLCNTATKFTFNIVTNYGVIIEAITYIDILLGTYHFTNSTYSESLTGQTRDVAGNLPKMKVADFISGLIKAFNLVVIPNSSTSFYVEPYDDWLADGGEVNLSKYVETDKDVMPASLYGLIHFKYSDTASILNKRFTENLNNFRQYGDLKANIVDSNGDPLSTKTFEIELPFTNLLYSRLTNRAGDNSLTKILVGSMFDINLQPITEKPIIFYKADNIDISATSIATKAYASNSWSSRTTYNLCFQFNTDDDSYTHSLNWGGEVNPYTLNDATGTSPSLYNDYWEDYITDLYNLANRRFSLKAYLPLSIISTIKLNDQIIIGTNRYLINEMKLNLSTGEANLELVNYIN